MFAGIRTNEHLPIVARQRNEVGGEHPEDVLWSEYLEDVLRCEHVEDVSSPTNIFFILGENMSIFYTYIYIYNYIYIYKIVLMAPNNINSIIKGSMKLRLL